MYSHLLITFGSRHGLLRVAGVLDESGRRQLRRRLDEAIGAGCLRLDVDCARVRHVAPETLLDLTTARRELERRGGALVVRTPSHIFSRAVRLAGREDLLDGPAGSSLPGGRAGAPAVRAGAPIDLTARIRAVRRKNPLALLLRRRPTASLTALDGARAAEQHDP